MENINFFKAETRQGKTILIFMIFISALFLINFASSAQETLGTFKQNSTVRITQVCSDATSINISSVMYPNSSVAVSNIEMVSYGNGEYYYNFSLTKDLGKYDVRGVASGCEKTFITYFTITYTGDEITVEQTYIYIVALIFLLLLALSLFYIQTKLPSKDAEDEEGAIVQVSMLKHLRPVLWAFIWIIGVACLFIISNLGIAHLPNLMIGKLFFTLYRIFFYATVIGVPVYFIWIFYKIFKDNELQKLVDRGVKIGGGNGL